MYKTPNGTLVIRTGRQKEDIKYSVLYAKSRLNLNGNSFYDKVCGKEGEDEYQPVLEQAAFERAPAARVLFGLMHSLLC